ncbi:MAG TPA: hypothetical protein VH437_20645 [Terriglobales bacterium]|jgi:cytochrome c biogenesis factor
MAKQTVLLESSKSLAGAALVGLGMFVLYQNLAGMVGSVNHVLGANSSEALGILPAAILAASQIIELHARNHHSAVQEFFRQVSIQCWPLILVTVGMVLSRDNIVMKKDKAFQRRCTLVAVSPGSCSR